MIKHEAYDHRSDIWSLGVVIYHMANLDYPFYADNLDSLMNQVLYKQAKPL